MQRNGGFCVNVRVGNNIKVYREKMCLNRSELAKILALSSRELKKYEEGQSIIYGELLFKLSKILNVPIHSFYE